MKEESLHLKVFLSRVFLLPLILSACFFVSLLVIPSSSQASDIFDLGSFADGGQGILLSTTSTTNGLFSWGGDRDGQLGNGDPTSDVLSPQRIGANTGWTKVVASYSNSFGIKDGKLYAWGSSDHGMLGNG